MTGIVFTCFPCITASTFNSSPSFHLFPHLWSFMTVPHGFHSLWEKLFLKRKCCKLLKWSMEAGNQILQCTEDENVLGLANGSVMLGFKLPFLKQNWDSWILAESIVSPFFLQRRKVVPARTSWWERLGPKESDSWLNQNVVVAFNVKIFL